MLSWVPVASSSVACLLNYSWRMLNKVSNWNQLTSLWSTWCKPYWLGCWQVPGEACGLLEATGATAMLGSLWGCWCARKSLRMLQMSIYHVDFFCSDMINWSGNQCEGIVMLHSFSKITRFCLPYWTYDSKSNVDLVLLADIFQTQFIKYSSQICSSSSNTVHQIQLQ